MNREIKFRGVCEISKGIVYGDLIHGVGNKKGKYYILPNKTNLASVKHCDPLDGVMVIPESVGQFTGREDAQIDGTEVYDGDIIENSDTKAFQIVFYNKEEAAWYCKYIDDKKRIVSLSESLGNLNKVIGNIHENPELL